MTSQVERRGHLGEAIGAAAVVGAGHDGNAAVGLDRVATRASSVATTTSAIPGARRACSTTRTIIGRPPRSMRGLPGSRVEA